MMIFFNDPVPVPDPAERAVRMAVAMRERVRRAGRGVAQARLRSRPRRRASPRATRPSAPSASRGAGTTARSAPSPTSPRGSAARRRPARSWSRRASWPRSRTSSRPSQSGSCAQGLLASRSRPSTCWGSGRVPAPSAENGAAEPEVALTRIDSNVGQQEGRRQRAWTRVER